MSATKSDTSGGTTGAGYTALSEMAPAFLPGWSPLRGEALASGPVEALLQVAGRYSDVLTEVLRRAGPKARLAHLDALGARLRPAQPSRGVVVFTLDPSGFDADAPAGTQLGAAAPGASSPVVFETNDSIVLVAAPLRDVSRVDPDTGRVTFLASTAPADGAVGPAHHALYLGDPSAVAVIPGAEIAVNLTLAPVPSGPQLSPIALTWEFYDGSGWHAFLPLTDGKDGTNQLTRSGKITLSAGDASGATTIVNKVGPMYWIRARAEPSAMGDATPSPLLGALPTIARVTVSSQLEPPLWAQDVSSRDVPVPGSSVTLKIRDEEDQPFDAPEVSLTVEQLLAPTDTGTKVTLFKQQVLPGQTLPVPVADRGDYKLTLTTSSPPPSGSSTPPSPRIQDVQIVELFDRTAVTVIARRRGALLDKAFNDVLKVDPTSTFAPFGEAPRPGSSFVFTNTDVMSRPNALATLFYEVLDDPTNPIPTSTAAAAAPSRASQAAAAATESQRVLAKVESWATARAAWKTIGSALLGLRGGTIWIMAIGILWRLVRGQARQQPGDLLAVFGATPATDALAPSPDTTAPTSPPTAVKSDPPKPGDATALGHVVAIEAWAGSGWVTLERSDDLTLDPLEAAALTLGTKGRYAVHFKVPSIPPMKWAGQDGQWMRLRLVQGGYGTTQAVDIPKSTTVGGNGGTTTFNVVTTKPPRLHAPRIAFRRELPATTPKAVLSDNDWQWRDHGAGLNQAGQAFQPFEKGMDDVSAMYLGFDGGLPAGMIGVDFDFGEAGEGDGGGGRALEWQYHDGSNWQPLEVEDDTADLTRSGVVRLKWPGLDEVPPFVFQKAEGNAVTLSPGTLAVRDDGTTVAPAIAYPAGSTFLVRDADGFETAVVASAAPEGWQLTASLSRAYKAGAAGTVGPVRLARFGTPRSWVRARPVEPIAAADWSLWPLVAVRANAVAVEQIETHINELLGPSNGAPGQNFRLRYHPVLDGEAIEVLELSGGRAAVEWTVLREDVLAAKGVESDLRIVYDPATGRPSEVWVRWRRMIDFSASRPTDRHYVIDATLGRLVFGDGHRGLIPPPGQNAVRARMYQAGGGSAGNVPAGAINQLLGPIVAVQAVTNPRPARGGADGETLELSPPVPVSSRGAVGAANPAPPPPAPDESNPITKYLARHSATMAQGRAAVTPADYEAIALDASAGINAVICLRPDAIPGGATTPGTRLRLVVLAQADQPSTDLAAGVVLSHTLKQTVKTAVAVLAPAWVSGRVEVTDPSTIAVDVSARVVSKAQDPDPDAHAGTPPDPVAVRKAAVAELTRFLNPRYVGPDGLPWLRRTAGVLTLSDLALRLSRLPLVDRVTSIVMSQGDDPAADRLVIPPGFVPVPRDIRVVVDLPGTGGST